MSPKSNASRVPPLSGHASKPQAAPEALNASRDLRILIVDDHTLVRDGLRQLLLQHFIGAYICEAGTAMAAIDLAQKEDWDIVLLDISLPGQSGVDVLKQI